MSNPVSDIKEYADKFRCEMKVEYLDINTSIGFKSQLRLMHGNKIWTSESLSTYSTKKAAQASAAQQMLARQDLPNPTDVFSLAKSSPAQENFKGKLHEYCQKAGLPTDNLFETTPCAPFLSTFTLMRRNGMTIRIVDCQGYPRKIESEQSVAALAMKDEKVRKALGIDKRSIWGRFLSDSDADDATDNDANDTNDNEGSAGEISPIEAALPPILSFEADQNYKGRLLELCSQLRVSPIITTSSTSPPFQSTITLRCDGKQTDVVITGAMCRAKRQAEQHAAKLTMEDPKARALLGLRPQTTACATASSVTTNNSVRALCESNEDAVVFPKLVGDCYDTSPDFQITGLLDPKCGKVIRSEQLEAFHRCLRSHMVIVLPTGFGKTLVASLVMKRFHLLNPKKIALMVVDRVPLVQQQCLAIQQDTGMKVYPLSGENSKVSAIQIALSGTFDAVVVTAGVLMNYIHSKRIPINCFSVIVLDECHHATREHDYSMLLQAIERCPEYLRPRVMGLSASPFNAKSKESAKIKLEKLQKLFFGAEFYRPPIADEAFEGVDEVAVALTPAQEKQEKTLVLLLQPSIQKLHDYFKLKHPEFHLLNELALDDLLSAERRCWPMIENFSAEAHLNPTTDPPGVFRCAQQIRQIINALHVNYLMGPAFVQLPPPPPPQAPQAQAPPPPPAPAPAPAIPAVIQTKNLSNQIQSLCALLEERGATSSTLIFVETRYTAETLTVYLNSRFPSLHCEKLIGQGGSDGMSWRGDAGQGGVLQRFRSQMTRVIVCTSVLEEGLDVKGCDLVIRFGGTPSLIQVVQSKGRARAETGKLYLIYTEEEEAHFSELKSHEKIIKAVLDRKLRIV